MTTTQVQNLRSLQAAILTTFLWAPFSTDAQTISDITDLVLVTGQSNVTGSQTEFDPQIDTIDLRVFAYTDSNDWEVADLHQVWDVDGFRPGNFSLTVPTRSPYNNFAFHFAKTVVENDPDRVVGIIIASAPGEGILHWDANSSFTQTIQSKVIAALNAQGVKSALDGILWHQGETDHQFYGTSDVDATAAEKSDDTYYADKLNSLIQRFRAENWFNSDKPFICGETKQIPDNDTVNDRLMALNSDNDPWTGCVAGEDLPTREMDLTITPPKLGTHFTAEGLRALGQRYGLKYLDMTANTQSSNSGTCNGLTANVVIANGDIPTPFSDVILGTDGADTINGLGGDDTICGLGGNDIINAGGGDDWIDGGTGNDDLHGTAGTDTIFGGIGDDFIRGGSGDDFIAGQEGNDTLLGQPGDDTIDGGNGIDSIIGGSGSDTIYTGPGATVGSGVFISGSGGNDTIFGGPDADHIIGSFGIDIINGGDGDDKITGGNGKDTIDGGDGDDDIRGQGQQDTINGGNGNDTIFGGDGNDSITGGTGNDEISGGSGNDTVDGNSGADLITGGNGDDDLIGGASAGDICDGQSGVDTADASCESVVRVP